MNGGLVEHVFAKLHLQLELMASCTYPCEANQTYNGIQCVCSTGFFNISGVCTTCPSGQIYNTTTKSCQNNCGSNAILNGTICQCIQNYYLINGACSQCPSGTHYNSSLQYVKLAVKTKYGTELNAFVSITSTELMVFV
jgi:hypothetical protein